MSLCSASLRESFSSRTSSFLRLCAWRDLRSSDSPAGRDDRAWDKLKVCTELKTHLTKGQHITEQDKMKNKYCQPAGWSHPPHIVRADTQNESERAQLMVSVTFSMSECGWASLVGCVANLGKPRGISGWQLQANAAQLFFVPKEALCRLGPRVTQCLQTQMQYWLRRKQFSPFIHDGWQPDRTTVRGLLDAPCLMWPRSYFINPIHLIIQEGNYIYWLSVV